MSPERMCELMDGGGIGFVGDSLTGQTASTFMNELHGKWK